MKNAIADMSTSKAAMTVGIAFISSILVVTLVDDFLLPNFVVPGDTEALARDVETNRSLLNIAIIGYLVVLVLDSIIGVALYVVLTPASRKLAFTTAAFRLLYAFTLILGLFALALQFIDVYGYASIKLVGYVFFALHILVLGYTVIKSTYMPTILGILLVVASFTYIVFFVDFNLPHTMKIPIMLTMLMAELSLSIWLMVKRKTLPET